MTRCKVCMHPDKEEFERKIATKELSMTKAAQLMNCNKSSVSRHMQNCFPKKIAEWVKPEPSKAETFNVINELAASYEELLDCYHAARYQANVGAATRVLAERRKHIEFMAKLTGQLPERRPQ